MGIDVYLRWKDQTKTEEKAQFTGFDTTKGNVGYLREAYHGGPYATMQLVPEGWADGLTENPKIPAAELRKRLPLTVFTTLARHALVYDDKFEFIVDVEDREAFFKTMAEVFQAMADHSHKEITLRVEQREQIEQRIAKRELPPYALSFVDFVELAEKKEAETGEPCEVIVSA